MMKKIALAVLGFFFAGMVMAGGIGVVDMDKVVKSLPAVKKMQEEIQKKFTPEQQKIMAMQKKFQDTQEKLKKDQAVMSKSALESAAEDLQQQAQTLQTAQMNFQKDVVAAQNDAMQKFFEQVKAVAVKVAKAKNLDTILPANGLLYSSPSIDYTQEIIDGMK